MTRHDRAHDMTMRLPLPLYDDAKRAAADRGVSVAEEIRSRLSFSMTPVGRLCAAAQRFATAIDALAPDGRSPLLRGGLGAILAAMFPSTGDTEGEARGASLAALMKLTQKDWRHDLQPDADGVETVRSFTEHVAANTWFLRACRKPSTFAAQLARVDDTGERTLLAQFAR